eukprot:GHUV01016534.1.p1 GENE.GHUV01016534.1~~GHUV01016534.1.p1  ORF type:complete len:239 (+),score=51.04 GHUV01016534.1:904-1620(+)
MLMSACTHNLQPLDICLCCRWILSAAQKPPDEALLLGQTEAYVEYDRTGRVIKGQEVKKRSRYEEDVYINNHTSVWGSWWQDGTWGYACCHSAVRNSYCTGKAGEKAAAETAEQMVRNLEAKAQRAAEEAEKRAKSTLSNAHLEKGNAQWGTDAAADDSELDPEKVKAAMKKLDRQEREAAQQGDDERKRKFNSLAEDDEQQMTPEEMEAYRLKKSRGEDPAAAFMGGASGTDGYDLL